MNIARRIALVTLAVPALVMGTVGTASAAGGSVANSCAVVASVKVVHTNGSIEYLRCGKGTSNVRHATVVGRPFYVKLPDKAPMCRQAGVKFYPNNRGIGDEAVITPTVRCR